MRRTEVALLVVIAGLLLRLVAEAAGDDRPGAVTALGIVASGAAVIGFVVYLREVVLSRRERHGQPSASASAPSS